MKRSQKLISIAIFSFASAVFAAPMKDDVSHQWTGFYAGINVGAVNNTMNITDTQAIAFNATLQQVSNPTFTAGFQAGYRRQLDFSALSSVYGFEFSANFAHAGFDKDYGSPFALYQFYSKNALENVCLLQLIAGIAADRTLLFFAAGLSWANITGETTNQASIGFFDSFNVNKKVFGTAFGGGVEYALNEHFSARFKVDIITPNTYTVNANPTSSFQIADSIVQGTIGINYGF